jgi:hypothetical protein
MLPQTTIVLGLSLALGSGCVAVSRTAPLSQSTAEKGPTFDTISLTSGEFARPHRVIGVIQMQQEGYKWLHEKEVIADADPDSVLYKLGQAARYEGAQGIQHLVLIDGNPQSPEEKTARQVATVIKILDAIANRRPPMALGDGTQTIYFVKGELVQFE